MDSIDCNICLRKFKTTYSLNLHMTKHTEEKIYISDKPGTGTTDPCLLKIPTRIDLNEHSKIKIGEKRFVCLTCGKTFGRKGNLKTHNRIHTGEKPYLCKVCGKAFLRKGGLKCHSSIHKGEIQHACTTRGNVRNEDKSHEPHVPTTLRKALKNISNSKIHDISDSAQKLYECNICGKTFSYRQSLKRHEKVHDEVKSSALSIGGREISLNSNVNIPDKIDNEERIYTCSNCPMSFSKSTQLEIHMECHQMKECDQYYSHTECLDNSLNLEMFPDPFETNSIESITVKNISSVLLYRDSHVETREGQTPLNLGISTDSLLPMYIKTQHEDLGLMSIEELHNPQMFFF